MSRRRAYFEPFSLTESNWAESSPCPSLKKQERNAPQIFGRSAKIWDAIFKRWKIDFLSDSSGRRIHGKVSMSVVIAKASMGFCPCGLLIEAGEQILMRPTGAVHLGCERLTAQPPELPEFQLTPLLFEDPGRVEDEETKAIVGAAEPERLIDPGNILPDRKRARACVS